MDLDGFFYLLMYFLAASMSSESVPNAKPFIAQPE